MSQTISENKKAILTELLHSLEDEISKLYHEVEDDETISDERFRVYEKYTDRLYSLHNELLEEIIFS